MFEMMETKKKTALELLERKYAELGRLPKKSDFSPETVCFIKQKLGAWPRALEAAGLKKPPAVSAKEKSRVKRERLRRKIKKLKKQNRYSNAQNTFSQKTEE